MIASALPHSAVRPRTGAGPLTPATASTRVALGVLTFGVVVCVTGLPFVTGSADAEWGATPREFGLHLAGWGAALAVLTGARAVKVGALDVALATFAAVGLASTLAAPNQWAAMRAVSIWTSGLLVFWSARALGAHERRATDVRRRLLAAVALSVGVVAASAVLEAYGLLPAMSQVGRGPGGLLRNRNRLAHLAALGLPAAVYLAMTAVTRSRRLVWGGLTFLMVLAVVLSRSRAAWLGVAVAAGTAAAYLIRTTGRLSMSRGSQWRVVAAATALALGVAVFTPNRLIWSSDTPFRDSASSVLDLRMGSGRVRVVQALNTLRMAMAHPGLGVGPGNWAVRYPEYASHLDPSYNPRARVPTNRLPLSDWLGVVAEYGFAGAGALLVVFGLAVRAVLYRTADAPGVVGAQHVASCYLLVASFVLGSADALLLTPAPMLVFALSAALLLPRTGRVFEVAVTPALRLCAVVIVGAIGVRPVVYGLRRLIAVGIAAHNPDVRALGVAARWDPGDYASRAYLAESWASRGRCDSAIPYAIEAFRLYPTAMAPVAVFARCRAELEPYLRSARPRAATQGVTMPGGNFKGSPHHRPGAQHTDRRR